jgi:hypothetical protein
MEQVRPKQGREVLIIADATVGLAQEPLSLQIDHRILKMQGCLID